MKDFSISKVSNADFEIKDGSILIAAITSCTNTSNPNVLIGAGLLAKKAVEFGLEVKPCVKRYLTKQIRSRFFEINPQDWKGAIFLPVEDFNVSKNTVFQKSRRMI